MPIKYSDRMHNKDVIKFQSKIIERDCWHCCLNCQNWDKECKLFHAIPPPNIIVVGCEEFEFSIPF